MEMEKLRKRLRPWCKEDTSCRLLNDRTMHHFANAENLEYEAINTDLMLAFFADHKVLTGKKEERKLQSESDVKILSHSILFFGASEARKG
jgi:hypothetical protein